MPIIKYTTQIDPFKTMSEIQQVLVKHGAKNISIDYEDGTPTCLIFLAEVNGELVNFRLQANWKGVFRLLKDDLNVPSKLKTEDQAKRVAWRIRKEWVEAQLAIVESEEASLAEVFLSCLVIASGQTLFEALNDRGLKYLTGSEDRKVQANFVQTEPDE